MYIGANPRAAKGSAELVDQVVQSSSCFELHDGLSWDGDGGASLGVTTGALVALVGLPGAEAGVGETTVVLDGAGDGLHDRLHEVSGVFLGEAAVEVLVYGVNQIGLSHFILLNDGDHSVGQLSPNKSGSVFVYVGIRLRLRRGPDPTAEISSVKHEKFRKPPFYKGQSVLLDLGLSSSNG